MARQASPHGWLVARWPGHYDPTKAKNLDISRRVTVERAQEETDYYIEGIAIALRGAGYVIMEYLLSPVPGASVPSAPVVTLAQISGEARHLAVSWTEPFDGGSMITDYDIRYKKSGDTAWTNWPHTGTARTATITGLDRGGISYDVQVNASQRAGNRPLVIHRI